MNNALSSVNCPVTREQCTEPLCCDEGMCQISEKIPGFTPSRLQVASALNAAGEFAEHDLEFYGSTPLEAINNARRGK